MRSVNEDCGSVMCMALLVVLVHIFPARFVDQRLIFTRLFHKPFEHVPIQMEGNLLFDGPIEFTALRRAPIGNSGRIRVRQIDRASFEGC